MFQRRRRQTGTSLEDKWSLEDIISSRDVWFRRSLAKTFCRLCMSGNCHLMNIC